MYIHTSKHLEVLIDIVCRFTLFLSCFSWKFPDWQVFIFLLSFSWHYDNIIHKIKNLSPNQTAIIHVN